MSSLLQESSSHTKRTWCGWKTSTNSTTSARRSIRVPGRSGKPRYARDGRMVGYAELDKDAEASPDSGLFQRRTCFLLPHDRPNDPVGL